MRTLQLFSKVPVGFAAIILVTGLANSSDRPIDKEENYHRQSVPTGQGSFSDSIIDPEVDWPVYTAVQQTGKVNAGFSCNGTFGTDGVGIPPDEWPPVNFECPAGSGLEYLFAGSIWIGGIVGEDTLVSLGFGGWIAGSELFPPSRRGTIAPIESAGDYGLRGECYDTATQHVRDDWSGRPHIPLNVRIANRSHVWRLQPYDNCIFYDVVVTNIGHEPIEAGYFGLMFDVDVQISGISGYYDDMTGSLRQHGIAYGIDNDGDPVANVWVDSVSTTRAFAMKYLETSFDILDTSYNWWVSNGNPVYDFGPRQAGTPEHPFRDYGTGGLGTPEGDANKYYMMSFPEWDYDQCYTHQMMTDPFDTIWVKPSQEISADLMNGIDIRFLMSVGPFDLEPDSSIRVLFTTFTGDSIHTNPDNLLDNLPEWPYAYLAELGLEHLLTSADAAQEIYDSLLNPHRAPVGFAVKHSSADSVVLEWDPWCFDDVDGCRLYLTEIDWSLFPYPGVIPPWLSPEEPSTEIVADLPYRHVLTEFSPDRVYAARVAYQIGAESGEKSPPVQIHGSPPPAAPEAVSFIVIQPEQAATICWSNPSGQPVDHFNIYKYADSLAASGRYLPFYSQLADDGVEAPVDSFQVDSTTWYYFAQQPYDRVSGSDTCFTDMADDGNVYVVTAVDANGFESAMTTETSVWIVPAASRDILLVTNSNLLAGPITPYDSIRDFYSQVLAGYDYEIFSVADSCPTSPQCRPNLRDLATFKLIVFDDVYYDNLPYQEHEEATRAITKYLLAGGSVAYFGSFSSFFHFNSMSDPRYRSVEDPFVESFFGVDSVFYVGIGYFIVNRLDKIDTLFALHCAEVVDPIYSDLCCDTTRYPMGQGWTNFWPTNTPPVVSAFFPSDEGQTTHVYRSLTPASSMVEGDPVGVKTSGDGWTTHLFGFHLYFMQSQQARDLVATIVASTTDVVHVPAGLPVAFCLGQNYPNPFNPGTTIEFNVPRPGKVTLTVYNVLGQGIVTLVDEPKAAGEYKVFWDGRDKRSRRVASGVYLYRLQTGDLSETRKMLLVK